MSKNKRVPVTGVNFGGWISQCPLTPEHMSTFITEADFKLCAQWGFTTIRLPFDSALIVDDDGIFKTDEIKWIDRAVEMAEANKIDLILDLHQIKGASFVNVDDNDLFVDVDARSKICVLWGELAKHYKKYGDFLKFELLNEAVAPTPEGWQSLVEEMTSAIRKHDAKRTLICGSNLWNTPAQYEFLKPTGDENTIYTFHCYSPMHITHLQAPWLPWAMNLPSEQVYPGEPVGLEEAAKDSKLAEMLTKGAMGMWNAERLEKTMKPVIDFKKRYKVDIFCGEFGVFLKSARKNQMNWLQDFMAILDKHELGFSYWNFRGLDYGMDYKEGNFSHLPQFQNEDGRDHELLQLLIKHSDSLKGK